MPHPALPRPHTGPHPSHRPPQWARRGSLALTLALLAACGGGELAILGYIGAAGGSYVLENLPGQNGLAARGCTVGSCTLALQPEAGVLFANLYRANYAISVVGSGTLGTGSSCTAGATGTVNGARLSVPGCFSGSFRNPTELLSDDGKTLLRLGGYTHNLTSGAWVDIERSSYRLKFEADDSAGTATGCALNGSASAVIARASYTDASSSTPPSIDTVTIDGLVWSAEMVGVSGLKLTRGSTVMQLARQDQTESCGAPPV